MWATGLRRSSAAEIRRGTGLLIDLPRRALLGVFGVKFALKPHPGNRETSGTSRSNQDRDRSEKANSRTADRHVSEESDRAIVPVNLSNKEGQISAEIGEGRARAEENIVPSHTRPTQSGKRVSQGLSGVRQAARERRQERFTAWLHHLSVDLLRDSLTSILV